MNAKDLITIPVWNGNRIIDTAHVQRIKDSLGLNIQKLDFAYRIVTYTVEDAGGNTIQESYIIDGQHRHRVLCDYFKNELCVPDFPVVVLEKQVACESEIITYFKELNNQKPIEWKTDPNMMANEYIKMLSLAFNKKKDIVIRPKSTTRPYLSSEKLRESLVACADLLTESVDNIRTFVDRVIKYNEDAVKGAELSALGAKKGQGELILKAANHKFMLAVDPRLPWVRMCLKG
jgi:hypothetical protein